MWFHILQNLIDIILRIFTYSIAYSSLLFSYEPITVAAQSKAWASFAHLNAEIVDSNPTQGMDICLNLFCVCV
jgi:hypothetical protein